MSLTTTTIERERCKQMMIELRGAKTNEKVGREIIKHYRFDEKVIKKKMNEVWFAKQCANINETLYIAI
jgi:hypothetical protein